jgi:hypothetical protein
VQEEIKILKAKIADGIASDWEREKLESLLRSFCETETWTKQLPEAHQNELRKYVSEHRLKAAQKYQRENPGLSVTLGGIPVQLFG